MNNFFHSRFFKVMIYSLAVIFIALIIFYAGIQVGLRKSFFSSRWGENYGRNFGGLRGGMIGLPPGDEPIGGHGTFGQIIRINLPQVVIKSPQDVEKIIVIGADTQIRELRGIINSSELRVGETVVVIGSPDSSGLIDADLIRVLPPAPGSKATSTP